MTAFELHLGSDVDVSDFVILPSSVGPVSEVIGALNLGESDLPELKFLFLGYGPHGRSLTCSHA